MVSIFTVFYEAQSNPNRTYYQNQNRRSGIRIFRSFAEAQNFAATVRAKCITNYIGEKVMVF